MNKTVKLYNLVFPVWLLWIVPLTWIVVLPVNFFDRFTCRSSNNEIFKDF